MLRFVKRLNYRDRVHEHLNALLVGYPPGRQFADDFPGLAEAIRAHFEAGVSAPSAALQIAAGIASGLLGQLDSAEKTSVLKGLARLDARELEAMAARRIAGARDELRGRVSFATQLAGLAIYMAGRMTQEGALRQAEYEFFLGELEKPFETEAGRAGSNRARAPILSEMFALPGQPDRSPRSG